MTLEEIKLHRIAAQHLLVSSDPQTVVKDLCGIQAQYLSHAKHGLSIRSINDSMDGMIKSWTIRGTMHLFSVDDLPLFLHEDRVRFLRPVDAMETDAYIDRKRKAYFADLILGAIAQGNEERETLKTICKASGMTEGEEKSIFDPWGGLIRALCEEGRVCHKAQEKKAFQICPPFEPMSQKAAQLELARRYFTHYGPATVKDCAYFFGTTQSKVKAWLAELAVEHAAANGNTYFFIGQGHGSGNIPKCLFLAGFDPLMLGYEKKESIFLSQKHLRDIFSLSGFIRPAILLNGEVVGWWSMNKRSLSITLFEQDKEALIMDAAALRWSDIQRIEVLR